MLENIAEQQKLFLNVTTASIVDNMQPLNSHLE